MDRKFTIGIFADQGTEAAAAQARRAALARYRSTRSRRSGDPATSDPQYTANEVEFLFAIDRHQRLHGPMESDDPAVLGVIAELGYHRWAAEA